MKTWLENIYSSEILNNIPDGVVNGLLAFIILIGGYIIARIIS